MLSIQYVVARTLTAFPPSLYYHTYTATPRALLYPHNYYYPADTQTPHLLPLLRGTCGGLRELYFPPAQDLYDHQERDVVR